MLISENDMLTRSIAQMRSQSVRLPISHAVQSAQYLMCHSFRACH